ncbi:hypothetical protein [Natrinema sp. 74]|uniref:hypothetical protein n=1 Tax=Natrinema sp. 74 TaxID=3384159 RepID=UPI0038D45B34
MTENTTQYSQTNSQRYGNEQTIDEVFERETSPIAGELQEVLADTAHLTDEEAFAFVHGHLEGYPPLSDEMDVADEIVQSQGFESTSEFNAIKKAAKEKIADAIWIYELIDAYRFPSLPEECTECSGPLGGTWVGSVEGSGPLCRDCADVDADLLNHL